MKLAEEGKIFIFPLTVATVFSFGFISHTAHRFCAFDFSFIIIILLKFFRDPTRRVVKEIMLSYHLQMGK